jgi:hypothetical protein
VGESDHDAVHGVISQKMILFITTAVKASNPTMKSIGQIKQIPTYSYFPEDTARAIVFREMHFVSSDI